MVPVTDVIAAVTIVITTGVHMQRGDTLSHDLNKRRYALYYECSDLDYDKSDEWQAMERINVINWVGTSQQGLINCLTFTKTVSPRSVVFHILAIVKIQGKI